MECLQVRDKKIQEKKLVEMSKKIREMFPDLFLIFNGSPLMAFDLGFEGVHLPDKEPSRKWLRDWKKNKNLFLSTSVHDTNSLKRTEKVKFDSLLISPVKNPFSKKSNLKPLGWDGFEFISKQTKVPTYALGGLVMNDLIKARKHGARGIAMSSYFFKKENL